MANTVPPKFDVQIGPSVRAEVAGELAAWGELAGESAGAIARQALDLGLAQLRPVLEAEHGKLDGKRLASHVERQRERGVGQRARRRTGTAS